MYIHCGEKRTNKQTKKKQQQQQKTKNKQTTGEWRLQLIILTLFGPFELNLVTFRIKFGHFCRIAPSIYRVQMASRLYDMTFNNCKTVK